MTTVTTTGLIAGLIKDIGSLWTLALIVGSVVVFFIYRQQIRGLLEKGEITVKRKDTEVQLVAPAKHRSEPLDAAEGEQPAPPPEDENERLVRAQPEPAAEGPEEEESPSFGEVWLAVRQGRHDEATRLFEALQDREHDPTVRLRHEIAFAATRAAFGGDPAALEEIEAFAKDSKLPAFAKNRLGMAYQELGYPDKALVALTEAYEHADDDAEHTAAAIGAARALELLDRPGEGIDRLGIALKEIQSKDDRRRLYIAAADIYRRRDDDFHRAMALSKAVELAPNDVSLRFDYAYAASQAELKEVSFLHYESVLNMQEDHAWARNNLGVESDRLDMPLKSIEEYRRAWAEGNTLAAANLGNRFLRAGFADEAREILNEAAKRQDSHPNVGSHLARLAEQLEQEAEKQDEVSRSGQERDRFLRDYAEARLVPPDVPLVIAGVWQFGDGREARIDQKDSVLEINWKDAGSEWKAEGPLVNHAVQLTLFQQEYVLSRGQVDWVKKKDARGAISSDANSISLLVEDQTPEHLTRRN